MYSKSTWMPQLRDKLNFTQTQVNIISSVGDFGMYVGATPVGKLYDSAGPQLTFFVSSFCLFGGYSMMCAASQQFLGGNAIMVAIALMFCGLGSIAGFNAAFPTNVRNFEAKTRGKVTGVLISGFGSSAALVTQIYRFFYDSRDDITGFLFLLSLLLGVLPLIGAIFVRLNPRTSLEDSGIQKTSEYTEGTVW